MGKLKTIRNPARYKSFPTPEIKSQGTASHPKAIQPQTGNFKSPVPDPELQPGQVPTV